MLPADRMDSSGQTMPQVFSPLTPYTFLFKSSPPSPYLATSFLVSCWLFETLLYAPLSTGITRCSWLRSKHHLNYATLPSTTKTDWECESHHTYQTKHRHHRCFEIRCRTDQGQFCVPPPPGLWSIHYTPCKERLTYHWAPFYVYCCQSKTCSITLSLGELLQHSKVPVDISTKTVNYFKQTDDKMNKHPLSSDLKQGKISVLF